jgi:hypothetical protein
MGEEMSDAEVDPGLKAYSRDAYRTITRASFWKRLAACVATVSLLAVSVACSKSISSGVSGLGQAKGPDGKTYEVGDPLAFGAEQGTYCGTIESPGTPEYPDIRHFAIGITSHEVMSDDDCSVIVQFFRDFIAAGVSMGSSSTFMWNGIRVAAVTGYSGQDDGYHATWLAGYSSPYGKMDGYAAGF